MGIKSISVNGISYKIDFDALENAPDLMKDIAEIQRRLSAIESAMEATADPAESDTSTTVSGNKLSLTGSGSNVDGEKLSVTGSEFTVNGEKLSIS